MPLRITFSPVGNSVSFAPYFAAVRANSVTMAAPEHSSTVMAMRLSSVLALANRGRKPGAVDWGRTSAKGSSGL